MYFFNWPNLYNGLIKFVLRFIESNGFANYNCADQNQNPLIHFSVDHITPRWLSFWVVAPCSLVEVYQSLRRLCCLHDTWPDNTEGTFSVHPGTSCHVNCLYLTARLSDFPPNILSWQSEKNTTTTSSRRAESGQPHIYIFNFIALYTFLFSLCQE
jgi:hypothetical protein